MGSLWVPGLQLGFWLFLVLLAYTFVNSPWVKTKIQLMDSRRATDSQTETWWAGMTYSVCVLGQSLSCSGLQLLYLQHADNLEYTKCLYECIVFTVSLEGSWRCGLIFWCSSNEKHAHSLKSDTLCDVVVMLFARGPPGEASGIVTCSQVAGNCMFSMTLGIVLVDEDTWQTTAVTPWLCPRPEQRRVPGRIISVMGGRCSPCILPEWKGSRSSLCLIPEKFFPPG